MNCLSVEKRAQVVSALIEGNSIRATVRMTGVCKDTVLKLLVDLGTACAAYHDAHVRNVRPRHVQCDEIWNFCYAKAKNAPDDKVALGAGDVWTWIAVDADTKLGISYVMTANCVLIIRPGKPDSRHISTSYVERQNLTIRMGMRRFTRLTNAFSKKLENLKAACALHFAHYNFCRVHSSLRITPAMAAGVSSEVWPLTTLFGG